MKKKSFLFFPVEIGISHMTRTFAIAEALYQRGHKVIVALPKRKQFIFKQSPVTLVDIVPYIKDDFKIKISDFLRYDFLTKLVDEELSLIKIHQPDVVIVDFRISALTAAKIANVKTVSISNGDILPCGAILPNPGFSKIINYLVNPVIRYGLYHGLRFYLQSLMRIISENGVRTTLDQWFKDVCYIVPEPDFLYPPLRNQLNINNVGLLSWKGFDIENPDWLKDIRPNGKTVYLTFGGTGFDKEKLIKLSKALVENGYRVIVSCGTIANPKDFLKSDNLYIAKFLPGTLISKSVDLVICAGGYGTISEAIANGTPILINPFNPDQIIHAARMQELGVARSLFKIQATDLKSILTFDWKRIENKGKNISVSEVLKNTKEMLSNFGKYKIAIKRYNANYKSNDGPIQAAEIIENL